MSPMASQSSASLSPLMAIMLAQSDIAIPDASRLLSGMPPVRPKPLMTIVKAAKAIMTFLITARFYQVGSILSAYWMHRMNRLM